MFGAAYVNVQPHSGSQANTAVYHACLTPGDKILGFDLSHGGHLTHGSPVNFSGKLYTPSFYGVEEETGVLNYDKIQEIATKEQPKLIIAGASAYSRDIDRILITHLALPLKTETYVKCPRCWIQRFSQEIKAAR